jgi:predicted nuclease of predicted toxin-antitoxin system
MRFLADQGVWKITVDTLRNWDHDVVTAKELGMARASDIELLTEAKQVNRLFITRDKEYGSLVFLTNIECRGVIFLRITPETTEEVHSELGRLLEEHSEEDLQRSFTTVELQRHRIRHIPLRPLV